MSNQTRRRGPMGHGHMGGEKAKDFKGAMKTADCLHDAL